MYHRINQPVCRPLEKINQLARLTIEFGLSQKRQESKPFRGIKRDFVQHFGQTEYPNAGEWLWGKTKRRTTIIEPLLSLLAIPIAEKDTILAAYEHDTDHTRCFTAPFFALKRLPESYNPALKFVNSILHNFYTDILVREGVPAEVIDETGNLTRQTLLQAYLNAQDKIQVCPGCDGSRPELEIDGTVYEDVDHFFPKSEYPFLAIHLLNLTPFCKYCNQNFKKDKDPLKLDDGTVIPLPEAVHPYLSPVQDEIDGEVERESADKLCVRLGAKEARFQNRLRSVNYLLHLESRWSGQLNRQYNLKPKILINYLLCAFEGVDQIPSESLFRQKLGTIASIIKSDIGYRQDSVITYYYTKFVIENDSEFHHLLQIVQTERENWFRGN